MIKIFLMGENGKMGKAVSKLAAEDPTLEIVEENCDIIIDFSSPEGTQKAIAKATAMGKPLVCGTTGLSHEIFSQLEALATDVPVLYSPNFSLGVILCFQMLPLLKNKGILSIVETHHLGKKDAPSGTALRMGEILAIEKENIASKRVSEDVVINQVELDLDGEKITLKHEAFSRNAFAKGALTAAKSIFQKSPGYYSLKEIFSLENIPSNCG